jgi:hypothetical protein
LHEKLKNMSTNNVNLYEQLQSMLQCHTSTDTKVVPSYNTMKCDPHEYDTTEFATKWNIAESSL